jgi:hypothetical protein
VRSSTRCRINCWHHRRRRRSVHSRRLAGGGCQLSERFTCGLARAHKVVLKGGVRAGALRTEVLAWGLACNPVCVHVRTTRARHCNTTIRARRTATRAPLPGASCRCWRCCCCCCCCCCWSSGRCVGALWPSRCCQTLPHQRPPAPANTTRVCAPAHRVRKASCCCPPPLPGSPRPCGPMLLACCAQHCCAACARQAAAARHPCRAPLGHVGPCCWLAARSTAAPLASEGAAARPSPVERHACTTRCVGSTAGVLVGCGRAPAAGDEGHCGVRG